MEEEFSQSVDISTTEYVIREHTAFPSVFTGALTTLFKHAHNSLLPTENFYLTQKVIHNPRLDILTKTKNKTKKESEKHGRQDEFQAIMESCQL